MSLHFNSLGGHEFEDLVERLLIKMGFSTEGRKPSADGGIDIIAVSTTPMLQGRYVVQCKRYSNPVSAPVIRQLYGVVNSTDANKGILITTSRFTSEEEETYESKLMCLLEHAVRHAKFDGSSNGGPGGIRTLDQQVSSFGL